MTVRALTRDIPRTFSQALARTAPAQPIDLAEARDEHLAYRQALAACGVEVRMLPTDLACPDCVFVEDTAVIADGVALITRPGAPTRQPETAAVADALATACEVVHMKAPATLDGGDVMRIGRVFYVGRSTRTSDAGIAILERTFAPRGYRVVPLDLPTGVLHLKCVVSPLAEDTILLADASLPPELFAALRIVRVPEVETYAANAVAIGKDVIVAREFPRTHEVLHAAGFTLHPVPTSQVRKADGSLTCQSLLY